jgi:hypothetical protein
MLLKKENKKIYFIHIPRTGGRFVDNLFQTNGYEKRNNNIVRFKDLQWMHLHYKYLKDFTFFKNNFKFTVVRDPFARFMSAAKIEMHVGYEYHGFNLKTVDDVLDYIHLQKFGPSWHNNWFRPQVDFIGDDVKVWKYEYGFKEDFLKFIKDNFDIDLIWHDSLWSEPCKIHADLKNVEIIKEAVKIAYAEDYKKFYD